MKNFSFLLPFLFLSISILSNPVYGFFQVDNDDRLRFTILHTNDEHSHLIPHPAIDDHPDRINSAIGGFARLAGAIHEIRNQKELIGEPVLLFSGGDILGGPVFGWLPLMDGVAAEISLFHLLEYDTVTIGNHESDTPFLKPLNSHLEKSSGNFNRSKISFSEGFELIDIFP